MEHPLVAPSRVRSAASLIERTGANDDYLARDDSAFCALRLIFGAIISSPWKRIVLSMMHSRT